MAHTVYVLMTWTTDGRERSVTRDAAALLQGFLREAARERGAWVVEIGVVPDHVHVLLQLPPVIDLPRLAQAFKGASARVINRDLRTDPRLKWAKGYDARSVSPKALFRVADYVRSQTARHGGPVGGSGFEKLGPREGCASTAGPVRPMDAGG